MSKNKMSKYAKKLARRSRLSKRLGLPRRSPYPLLWANGVRKLASQVR